MDCLILEYIKYIKDKTTAFPEPITIDDLPMECNYANISNPQIRYELNPPVFKKFPLDVITFPSYTILYHGTNTRQLERIKQKGLQPQGRGNLGEGFYFTTCKITAGKFALRSCWNERKYEGPVDGVILAITIPYEEIFISKTK